MHATSCQPAAGCVRMVSSSVLVLKKKNKTLSPYRLGKKTKTESSWTEPSALPLPIRFPPLAEAGSSKALTHGSLHRRPEPNRTEENLPLHPRHLGWRSPRLVNAEDHAFVLPGSRLLLPAGGGGAAEPTTRWLVQVPRRRRAPQASLRPGSAAGRLHNVRCGCGRSLCRRSRYHK